MNHERAFIRVNLVLNGALSHWLDQQTEAIRRAGGAKVTRSGIVRAILAALRGSGLDLTRYRAEDQLMVVATVGLRSAALQFQGHYTLDEGGRK